MQHATLDRAAPLGLTRGRGGQALDRLSPSLVRQRRQDLERYMRTILRDPQIRPAPRPPPLFLEMGRGMDGSRKVLRIRMQIRHVQG